MRQNATTVTGGENVRDHLEVVLAKDFLDFLESRHVLGRLEVDRVEPRREQDTVKAVFRSDAGDPAHILDVLVRAEAAGNIDPAMGQDLLGGPGDTRQEDEGKAVFAHGGEDYIRMRRPTRITSPLFRHPISADMQFGRWRIHQLGKKARYAFHP